MPRDKIRLGLRGLNLIVGRKTLIARKRTRAFTSLNGIKRLQSRRLLTTMSGTTASTTTSIPSAPPFAMRKNGKPFSTTHTAFRPTAGQTSYTKRIAQQKSATATKALERELKDAKQVERDRRIQGIKDRRSAKAEKERYEKMAEKMHRKVVERRRRREKRNKLLKSGK